MNDGGFVGVKVVYDNDVFWFECWYEELFDRGLEVLVVDWVVEDVWCV